MEDFAGRLQRMRITEAERGCRVEVGDDDIDEADRERLSSVYCKLLISKSTNADSFRRLVPRIWGVGFNVQIESQGRNLFQCHFTSKEEKDSVVEGGPWSFDNGLIVFEESFGKSLPEELGFNKAEFWIQVKKLPSLCLSRRWAEVIGNTLGEFRDVDIDENNRCRGRTLRIRVNFDVSIPLKRGIFLKLGSMEEDKWYEIAYERLPEFCFGCGMLGHSTKDCKEEFERGVGDLVYGGWLRAEGGNGGINEPPRARSPGGRDRENREGRWRGFEGRGRGRGGRGGRSGPAEAGEEEEEGWETPEQRRARLFGPNGLGAIHDRLSSSEIGRGNKSGNGDGQSSSAMEERAAGDESREEDKSLSSIEPLNVQVGTASPATFQKPRAEAGGAAREKGKEKQVAVFDGLGRLLGHVPNIGLLGDEVTEALALGDLNGPKKIGPGGAVLNKSKGKEAVVIGKNSAVMNTMGKELSNSGGPEGHHTASEAVGEGKFFKEFIDPKASHFARVEPIEDGLWDKSGIKKEYQGRVGRGGSEIAVLKDDVSVQAGSIIKNSMGPSSGEKARSEVGMGDKWKRKARIEMASVDEEGEDSLMYGGNISGQKHARSDSEENDRLKKAKIGYVDDFNGISVEAAEQPRRTQ